VTLELVANSEAGVSAVYSARESPEKLQCLESFAFCLQLEDENVCTLLICSSQSTRTWRRASFVQKFGTRGETLYAEGNDKVHSLRGDRRPNSMVLSPS
jgi:hypothetical protein